MSSPALSEARKGLWYALSCYLIWGLFPLYWYPLNHAPIDAGQILAQRVVWSALFAGMLLLVLRQGRVLLAAVRQPRLLGSFVLSGLAIGLNWLVFLWAMTNNHVLDASLGYFISPLFSILLGRLIFKEPLNRMQALAIGLALVGILWLAVPAGKIPWIAILLTISFGAYSLLRKTAPLAVLPGLVLETLVMLPFAAAYLTFCHMQGTLVFGELNHLQLAVLLGSGAVTSIPLLLFAASARRIPLSTLGIIQYGSPTLQMITGLMLFGERFDVNRFIGYVWVWVGVAAFLFGLWQQKHPKAGSPT